MGMHLSIHTHLFTLFFVRFYPIKHCIIAARTVIQATVDSAYRG